MKNTTELPSDYASLLSTVSSRGILSEDISAIDNRLIYAMQGVSSTIKSDDLGIADWATQTLKTVKRKIHEEICDPKTKKLKKLYDDVFSHALSQDSIKNISAFIAPLVAAINPGLAVSSILIFLAIWLLKIGANAWCATTPA